MQTPLVHVIIVGGSYAGMSAALTLARSHRKVIIIDGGKPCNSSTPHSHNFLTQDGVPPAVIAEKARTQLLRYPSVDMVADSVVSVQGGDGKVSVVTKSGTQFAGKRLVIATGINDLLPDIAGFRECWGISVLHCPYCHGYEVSHQRWGVLVSGEHTLEYVSLLYNWSKDLILFSQVDTVPPDHLEALKRVGVRVVESRVKVVHHYNGHISRVETDDGNEYALDALFSRIPFSQQGEIAAQAGCELLPSGHIAVDQFGKTSATNVFAAGDCCQPMRSVSVAVASGNMAGAAINRELLTNLLVS